MDIYGVDTIELGNPAASMPAAAAVSSNCLCLVYMSDYVVNKLISTISLLSCSSSRTTSWWQELEVTGVVAYAFGPCC